MSLLRYRQGGASSASRMAVAHGPGCSCCVTRQRACTVRAAINLRNTGEVYVRLGG